MFRPGHTFGHYLIESVLGEGGMGIVYEATDERAGGKVALKVVNPDLAVDYDGNGGIEAARRLVREGRAAASLRHPNAIAVLDAGEFDGIPYIAMEIARGRALGQFIGDKRVPMDQRVEWLCAMARGLAAAHSKGIVHRDVKPENVMVCDDGAVKLFDFGVAKPFADSRAPIDATVVTHTGIVVGTPLYMAPEQVLGEKLDPRSDQYAWATVAYELLSTGKHPISTTSESHLPVPFAILKGIPKHLLEVAPAVPSEIATVVMRALSKDSPSRYGHMDQIVEALDRYLAMQADADTTAPRDAPTLTPWPHTELTVAMPGRSPERLEISTDHALIKARPPHVAVIRDVREAVTLQIRREPAPAPAVETGSPEPSGASPSLSPIERTPESRRRAGGVSLSRPLASSPRGPIENRADPSVLLGPASLTPAPAAPPDRLEVLPGPESRPLEPPIAATPVTQSATGAVSIRSFAPPPLPLPESRGGRGTSEWLRLLWIPILIVAALAGYGSYTFLVTR